MSITTDLRAYADKTVANAQAQLNDVTGQANELVGKLTAPVKTNVSDLREKATEAVTDFRSSAEKAVNLDALKSAVEPYLTQVKGIQAKVHEQVETLLEKGKSDPRFGKYVETFEVRVVKPVLELANRGTKQVAATIDKVEAQAAPATRTVKKAPAKAAAKASAAKASTTRTAKATATKASKATSAKAPAKKAPARKAPATKA